MLLEMLTRLIKSGISPPAIMQHTGQEAETVSCHCTAASSSDFHAAPLVKFKKYLQIFSIAELQTLVQVTSALLGKGNLWAGLLHVQHGENTESPWKILPYGLEKQ